MPVDVADPDAWRKLERSREKLRKTESRSPVDFRAERTRKNAIYALSRIILIDDLDSHRSVVLLIRHAETQGNRKSKNLEGSTQIERRRTRIALEAGTVESSAWTRISESKLTVAIYLSLLVIADAEVWRPVKAVTE